MSAIQRVFLSVEHIYDFYLFSQRNKNIFRAKGFHRDFSERVLTFSDAILIVLLTIKHANWIHIRSLLLSVSKPQSVNVIRDGGIEYKDFKKSYSRFFFLRAKSSLEEHSYQPTYRALRDWFLFLSFLISECHFFLAWSLTGVKEALTRLTAFSSTSLANTYILGVCKRGSTDTPGRV